MTPSRWRALAWFGACVSACLTLAGRSHAQVAVAVSAPATVQARTPVLVRVEVTAPAGASVRLAPPAFAPFVLARTDRAPTDTAGLRGRQRLEWRFVLRTSRAGTFTFDPFEVDVQGAGLRPATFRSRAWSVAVLPAVAPAPPGAITRSDLTATDPARLAFDAHVVPERVYVGEQATLELRVGVGARVRERLRRSPEFAFPSVSGVVTYDLSTRHASTAAGDVHVYRRAFFPLAAGTVNVPASQLVYALTPEDNPFGAEQRITARTPVRRLVALAPPADGRPATWDGAVGRFRASARVDTAHARVGDAVTYTLRVEGTGNVLLLPRPALTVAWAEVSPAAERVAVDSSGDLAGGSKEFDWLLTPRAAGAVRVPPAHYAYFDPRTSGYAFADAPAVELRVAPGPPNAAAVAVGSAPRVEVPAPSGLGVRRRWEGELGPVLANRRGFWVALAAVPVPGTLWLLGAASIARRRTRRGTRAGRADGRDPASPRTLAAAALAEFTDGLSRVLGRPDVPTADARTLARALRRAGVSSSLTAECVAAVDAWTHAAYGTGQATAAAPDGAPLAPPRALLARVAGELDVAGAGARTSDRASGRPPDAAPRQLPRHAHPGLAVGVATLALATLALAFAAPRLFPDATGAAPLGDATRAVPAFDAGVAAYARGDAARARDLFAVAAAAAPGAPGAWLNAGTAAWATGDTASAAFAWQRAARLAPTFPGLRSRLDRLPAVATTGHVGAPPLIDSRLLSVAALAVAGIAALWMVVAATAYARGAYGTPGATAVPLAWRGASTLYLVAVALASAAALAARGMDPRGLAVVRAGTALRPEPVLGASAAASVATGEVAQVVADEAGWLRVRLDGGRDGWLRAAQLAPLDGTP